MKPKALVGTVLLGAAAFAVVLALYSYSPGTSTEPKISGKLSDKSIEVENRYRELQEKWKGGEKRFAAGQDFKLLSEINVGFNELKNAAEGIRAELPVEKDALVHLVSSLEASAKLTNVFLMSQVNPILVKPEHWAQAKAWGDEANREWKTWVDMTRGLSR